mgnify:CR=1 FL=1
MIDKDDVNTVNTRTWIKMNDNTKSEASRKAFLDTYGGVFNKGDEGYVWKEKVAQHIEQISPLCYNERREKETQRIPNPQTRGEHRCQVEN